MVKIECPNCKAQIEENIKFCTECGSKMEQVTPEETTEELKCPNCSTQLPPNTKFCNECGTKIETAPKEVICPKCSKKLPVNIKFCTDCGTKIEQPVSSQKSDKDPVDETIETLKGTGKDLMKEAGNLFKKYR
ncbi:MAG: zinc ribbon domain-containing protein [Methanobacterium sp.]|uniref:zinc ribbon domain-containing protein n=1 Tax=Methanobacterium sp. TaxID=2164 RepID=UPI003D65019B|nr:zinc ribbon domain-containing protein [Methanobacterium sp.]